MGRSRNRAWWSTGERICKALMLQARTAYCRRLPILSKSAPAMTATP